MFMWLGYKLGEWLDVWEENHKVHNQQIFLGGNWWLFSGMGALVDVFLLFMFLFWARIQLSQAGLWIV